MGYDEWLEAPYTTEKSRYVDCPECDGVGSTDADFDYDAGRFVAYGSCERCEGDGVVEREEQ